MSAIDNSEITDIPVEEAQASVLDSVVNKNEVKREGKMFKKIEGERKEVYSISKPSRVLHFSDGTLEEYDDSDEDDGDVQFQDPSHLTLTGQSNRSIGPTNEVDPKLLSWPAWFQHYSSTGSHRTLNFLDRMGENIAYYLGITTPKYQYEIDEYHKAKAEAEAHQTQKNIELASWKPESTRTSFDPITNQVSPVNSNVAEQHPSTKSNNETMQF